MKMMDDLAEVVRVSNLSDQIAGSSYGSCSEANIAELIAAGKFLRTHAAEIERNARDAARYRWLRDRAVHFELDDGKKGTPYIVYGLGMGDSEPTWGTEADSIIDECKAIDDTMRGGEE